MDRGNSRTIPWTVGFEYLRRAFQTLQRGTRGNLQKQMVLSSAALMVEHPDKAKYEQAVALRVFSAQSRPMQAIRKQDPPRAGRYG